MLFMFITWALAYLVLYASVSFLMDWYPALVTLILWLGAIALSWEYFLTYVPGLTGVVYQDPLTKTFHAFPSGDLTQNSQKGGLYFIKPWWQIVIVRKDKTGRERYEVELKTFYGQHDENFAANDGLMMHIKWSWQWRIKDVARFIEASEDIIHKGVRSAISAFVSAWVKNLPGDKVREGITNLEKSLLDHFGENGEGKKELEDKYGIDLFRFPVEDIDYPLSVQKAAETRQALKEFTKSVKDYQSQTGVDAQKADETAQVVGGFAKKTIFDVRGLEGLGALAKPLAAGAQALEKAVSKTDKEPDDKDSKGDKK